MVKYLLSIICVAIITTIVTGLFEKNNIYHTLIRLLSGMFLAITVISPLVKMNIPNVSDFLGKYDEECLEIVEAGKNVYEKERRAIISEEVEAYILDKATSLGVEANVCVELNDADPPIPCYITFEAVVSPYVRTTLEHFIVEELGIAKEHIAWK